MSMSLKSCVFTGAAMILALFISDWLSPEPGDPPGVITRWWDGSLEEVQQFDYDGKLYIRTRYGEDGKSVISYERFRRDGMLSESAYRLDDGTIERKWYSNDNTVTRMKLRTADDANSIEEREYYKDGTLESEKLYTRDGNHKLSHKSFYPDGQLKESWYINRHGDTHEESYFKSGQLKSLTDRTISGELKSVSYYSDGSLFKTKSAQPGQNGERMLIVTYAHDGKTLVRWQELTTPEHLIVTTVHENGHPLFRQTWKKESKSSGNYWLSKIEEFQITVPVTSETDSDNPDEHKEQETANSDKEPDSPLLRRLIGLDLYGNMILVENYRDDGSLARKQVRENPTGSRSKLEVSDTSFDESGTNSISTKVEDSFDFGEDKTPERSRFRVPSLEPVDPGNN